jgi:phage baseplate assembly protein W
MIGISRTTGQMLTGWAYFVELASDALTTPLGSREKQRLYGSKLPSLLSKLNSNDTLMFAQIYATQTFYEPSNLLNQLFTVEQIIASRTDSGIEISITGEYQGQRTNFEVPINAT